MEQKLVRLTGWIHMLIYRNRSLEKHSPLISDLLLCQNLSSFVSSKFVCDVIGLRLRILLALFRVKYKEPYAIGDERFWDARFDFAQI